MASTARTRTTTFKNTDPVRGVTNLSSGKMGFALAQACAEAAAAVTLVAGPTAQPTPAGDGTPPSLPSRMRGSYSVQTHSRGIASSA